MASYLARDEESRENGKKWSLAGLPTRSRKTRRITKYQRINEMTETKIGRANERMYEVG